MLQSWRIVQRVADRHLSHFVRPHLESVARIRGRITDEVVAEAMAAGLLTPPTKLLALLDEIEIAKAAEPAELARRAYSEVINATVHSMYEFVRRGQGERAAKLIGSFNVTSPQVLRAAETLTANLVSGVTEESRRAIRRVIFNSIRDGVAPRDSAKLIRAVVGLTERQALAVDAYRRGLGDAKNVDRLVERFAQRSLKQRALTIARTETMLAANRGQQLLWAEMIRDGLVDTRAFRQRWMVTPDDRLCSRCAPMDGKVTTLSGRFEETERGVLPSQRVPVSGTTVQSPPLHPRCRCTLVRDDV